MCYKMSVITFAVRLFLFLNRCINVTTSNENLDEYSTGAKFIKIAMRHARNPHKFERLLCDETYTFPQIGPLFYEARDLVAMYHSLNEYRVDIAVAFLKQCNYATQDDSLLVKLGSSHLNSDSLIEAHFNKVARVFGITQNELNVARSRVAILVANEQAAMNALIILARGFPS